MALAVDAGVARDAGNVRKLVGVRLVHGKGRLAAAARQVEEDGRTQDCGVVHAAVQHVLADLLVNAEDAALGGAHAPAVAGERVDALERNASGCKSVEDGCGTELQLVGRAIKASQHGGVVADVLPHEGLLALKDRHLGGGGAGGQCKNAIRHVSAP